MKQYKTVLESALGILILIAITVTISYNGLVSKDESVKQANAKIEAALQRRSDLIPNVVEATKGYMSHESDVFEKIAEARSKIGSGDKQTKADGEGELSSAISRLL